jgi:hypothetical protein
MNDKCLRRAALRLRGKARRGDDCNPQKMGT